MNIGATLLHDTQTTGMSAIIRDSLGDVIVARALRLPGIMNPFWAEAKALYIGLRWLQGLHISNLVILTD